MSSKQDIDRKRINRKTNFMFKIPVGYMTEDIKKTQTEAIHAFMQMRYSIKTKSEQKMLDDVIGQFETKLNAYRDAIVSAMRNGPFEDELKKHEKKNDKN